MKRLKRSKSEFQLKEFCGSELLCHNGKICVPNVSQGHLTKWCHEMLLHPGIDRTEETINQHFTWPASHKDVREHVPCDTCQKHKRPKKKHGHLPPKQAESQP